MTYEVSARKTIVSLWVPITVVLLGLTFLVFVFVEYQRNISLVEQNRVLISGSAKARLANGILNSDKSRNWGRLKEQYNWIQEAPHTYWFAAGVQEFPWRRSPSAISKTEIDKWGKIWSDISSTSLTKHINQERLTLLKEIKAALDSNDELSIQQSFDTYLEHKNAYHLSPQQEVAFSLKLVEIGAQNHWSSELVHAILITGGSSETPIVRPVIDVLFRHAELFSAKDFDWIITNIQQQLEVFNLSSYFLDDYLSHINEPRFTLPHDYGEKINHVNTVTKTGWFLHHDAKEVVSAEPIVLTEELKKIEHEFIELGVLENGDSLVLIDFADSIPIQNVDIEVDKAQLKIDQRSQLAYLIIKSIMLVAFMALILLTLRLIEKNQQRRFEYLALKEDFVKLVSHELKTPLAGIRAMAETLRKRVERDLSVEAYPERIVSEADKLWYMVDNILGFNRVQSTDAVIDKRPTKLQSMCDKVIDDVRSFSNSPYLVNSTIDGSIEVLVDAELFSLVVKNLIINAGLYNEHATIEIELAYDQNTSCLSVSDNGVGIMEADRGKIFKPFVRLNQSVRQSGTGLGLAICKRIMQLHNGDLLLAESSDHGSIWKINFTN